MTSETSNRILASTVFGLLAGLLFFLFHDLLSTRTDRASDLRVPYMRRVGGLTNRNDLAGSSAANAPTFKAAFEHCLEDTRFVTPTNDLSPSSGLVALPGDGQATFGSWIQFRGPGRSNLLPDFKDSLESSWPASGPRVLWTNVLCEGHSGPAIADGRLYILDHDEKKHRDVLRGFDALTGREIGRWSYGANIKKNHGITRTVPALSGPYVITLGPKCHAMCVDRTTGAFLWGKNLPVVYEADIPLWYTGQCPLVDGDRAIFATGGKAALLVALDVRTGEELWRTPNPRGWKMSHSSVMAGTMHGVKVYAYFALGGLAVVAADGPKAGRILWDSPEWAPTIVVPSPLLFEDGRLFATAGYGAGSAMFKLETGEDVWTGKQVYRLAKSVFACEQQTPVLRDGLLYTVMPNDAGAHRGEAACLDPADGRVRWTSGPANRFGLGPFMLIGDRMLLLDSEGTLTLAAIGDGRFDVLRKAKILDGHDAWAPMVLVDGLLYLRDSTRLVCLDFRKP